MTRDQACGADSNPKLLGGHRGDIALMSLDLLEDKPPNRLPSCSYLAHAGA